jgi:acetolactate synthase-1/2/3 large subunit
MVTDKSLASMGYGLSGAIGASIAFPNKRTILIEGDGGFAQNMQEIGTVKNRNLNLKMFIASNKGYASIRTTQKAYFNNNYVGCDDETGLGLPNWQKIFEAYGIKTMHVDSSNQFSTEFLEALNVDGPFAFIIDLDPDQLYFPKLTSRVMPDGRMESNPLHLMTPPLAADISTKLLKWL